MNRPLGHFESMRRDQTENHVGGWKGSRLPWDFAPVMSTMVFAR